MQNHLSLNNITNNNSSNKQLNYLFFDNNNTSNSSNKKLFENELKNSIIHNNNYNNYKSDLNPTKNLKNSLISINSSYIKNVKNNNNYNNNHYHHNNTIKKLTVITIDEAENDVKNLLSGFLNNVDEDDKKKFNVDDEIKRIKYTNVHNNNHVNFDSHSSSSSGFEDYLKHNHKNKNLNKNKILKKKSRKRGVDFILDYEKKNSFNKNFKRLMTSDIILNSKKMQPRKNSKNFDGNNNIGMTNINFIDGKKKINKSKSLKNRNSYNFNKKLLREKFERLNSNISEDFPYYNKKKKNIKFLLDDDHHSITSKSKKKTFKSKNSNYFDDPEREREILLKSNTRGSNLSRNSSITKSIFNFKQTLSFKKKNSLLYSSHSLKFEGKKTFGDNNNNNNNNNKKKKRNKLNRHLTIDHKNLTKDIYDLKYIKQKLDESIILNHIKKDKEFIDFNKDNKDVKRRNSLIQKNNLFFQNLFNNLNANNQYLNNDNSFLSKKFFNYNDIFDNKKNSIISNDKKILKSLKKTIIAGLEENDKDFFKKLSEENEENNNNHKNIIKKNSSNNNIMKKNSNNFKNSIIKKNSNNFKNSLIKKTSTNKRNSLNKKINNEDDKSDIRNFIPLSKQNYNKFNNLCDNLKNSLIQANSENLTKSLINSKEKNSDSKKTENITKKNSISSFSKDKIISEMSNEHYKRKLIKEFQFRRLTRQNKLVYDSLSDEESLEEIVGEFFLNPKDKIKIIFDFFICFSCLYSSIYPPIVLAFHTFESNNKFNEIPFIIDLFIDFLYILDFFLGFITGFYDFEEYLITNNKFMFYNYLTSWFTFDILTGFPFNTLFNILKTKNHKFIFTFINDKKYLFELFRLFRNLKCFKIFLQNSFFNFVHELLSDHDEILMQTFLIGCLIIFLLISHLLCCIFLFLGQITENNWLRAQKIDLNGNRIDIYVAGFYYIFATVFTVGYGDITSINIFERLYNLFLLLIGIAIYSYTLSSISTYIQNMDNKSLELENKLKILAQIKLLHENMPESLNEKIVKFLYYEKDNQKKDKNQLIDTLPIALRNKLIIEMYKDVINNFIFFKKYSNTDFIIRVILELKPYIGVHNERLVKEGEYIEEILFVKKGILSLEIPLPIAIKDETLKKLSTMNKLNRTLTNNNSFQRFGTINNNSSSSLSKKSTFFLSNLGFANTLKVEEINKIRKEINLTQNYVKIIEITENEHFGDILMFLNKRSPLSVKVKSKTADLFLLKKNDAVEISMDFPLIWKKIIKKSLFNMEQIERIINQTLKFFYIYNEGEKKINKLKSINYYKNSLSNKLLNTYDIYNSILNDQNELKSIPSEHELENEEEEEEEEDEEEEEEEDEEEDEKNEVKVKQNKFLAKKKKKGKNFDSIIAEQENEDDTTIINQSLIKKTLVSKNSYLNNNTFKNKLFDNTESSNIGETQKHSTTLLTHIIDDIGNTELSSKKNILNKKSTIKEENEKKKESSDDETNKTKICNFEAMNIFSDDSINLNTSMENSFSKNNHKSVISTNSNSLPYAINEINNENFPFENINLNNFGKISFNITPSVIKDSFNTNYICKSNTINSNGNNKKNVLITSYNYLVIIKIYEFTISKKATKNNTNKNLIRQFTKISKKKSIKSIKSKKSRKSMKSRTSKQSLQFSMNNNGSLVSNDTIKLDDNNFYSRFESKKNLIKSSSYKALKRENSLKSSLTNNKLFFMNKAGTKNYHSSTQNAFARVKSLKPNFGANSDLYKRQKSMQKNKPLEKRRMSKMLFFKKKSFLKFSEDESKIKKTKTIEQLNPDNDVNSNNTSSGNANRSNILDLISQNIEKNSLNLNNPQIFYENYFNNVINKNAISLNSNSLENKDVSSRLSDIGKLIKRKNKKIDDNKN